MSGTNGSRIGLEGLLKKPIAQRAPAPIGYDPAEVEFPSRVTPEQELTSGKRREELSILDTLRQPDRELLTTFSFRLEVSMYEELEAAARYLNTPMSKIAKESLRETLAEVAKQRSRA